MPETQEVLIRQEGDNLVFSIPKNVHFPAGKATYRQDPITGDLVVSPSLPAPREVTTSLDDSWAALSHDIAELPYDPLFLKQRPGNQSFKDRKIFSDD